jgi:tetratricopeptide (TPR) repeat protein
MPFPVLSLLQRPRGILDILVYLLDKKEAKVTELGKELGLQPSTCHAAVQSLKELGLIFPREELVRHRQSYIGLTVKGSEIAVHLRPISETLESTLSALELELRALEAKERTRAENRRTLKILLSLMDSEFTLGKFDTAESRGKRALDISSALDDRSGVARALRLLGEIHFAKGRMDEAAKEFNKSLLIRTGIKDLSGASGDHYFLGAIKEKKGDLRGALRDYKEAESLAETSEDEVLRARAGLGIGRVLAKEGKYDQSLKRFKQSIDVFEKADELEELPRAYTCAGSSAFYMDVDEAIGWHQRCIDLSRRIGDVRMLAQGLSNLAGCHSKKGESKKALLCLREANRILKAFDEKDMIVGVEIHTGWAHSKNMEWNQADLHFLEAIDVARKHGFTYELGDALLNYGLMNIDRGKTEEAKRQLKQALEIFEKLDNQQKVKRVREALGGISR